MVLWLTHVRLLLTPWTVAHRAPLSTGFSRQEHWRGLPFPPPGGLPDPEVEPRSAALQAVLYHSATREAVRRVFCIRWIIDSLLLLTLFLMIVSLDFTLIYIFNCLWLSRAFIAAYGLSLGLHPGMRAGSRPSSLHVGWLQAFIAARGLAPGLHRCPRAGSGPSSLPVGWLRAFIPARGLPPGLHPCPWAASGC